MQRIEGLEIVEADLDKGGTTLRAGQILVTLNDDDLSVGNNGIQVLASDIDMVILACPPHFRPMHLKAAIEVMLGTVGAAPAAEAASAPAAEAPVAAAPAAAAAAEADLAAGEGIYGRACVACHATGAAGGQ